MTRDHPATGRPPGRPDPERPNQPGRPHPEPPTRADQPNPDGPPPAPGPGPERPGPAGLGPGLARERTQLAWRRTAISFAALGGAELRYDVVAGALILAASATVWAVPRLLSGPVVSGPRWQRRSRQANQLVVGLAVGVSLVCLVIVATGLGQRTG